MTHPTPVAQVIKRDGQVVAYDRERMVTAIFKAAASVGGRDRAQAEELADQVGDRLAGSFGDQRMPTVEDVQDQVEAVLMAAGHLRTARAYVIYRHERARAREARANVVEATDNIPYRKIYEVLRWNMDRGCETVEGLNELIAAGRFPDLIAAGEERYLAEVKQAAGAMLARPGTRIVIIAGPSSSGKTTTTLKAGEHLRAAGRELVALTVDHYFFNLDQHPKDEFGDYDYETPQALDMPLINRHLHALLAGEAIRTPHYDFKKGLRMLDVHPMKLEPHQILLIDSLHGLHADMTEGIGPDRKFRLYIETLGQLRTREGVFMRWADNRLLRRMIRDSWHRNHKPMETLTHWHYVRSSEMKHIIPFIGGADFVVNSALPHELPLLKPRLFDFFPEALRRFRDDAKRQDAYFRAKRVFEMLDPLTAVTDDSCVPPTSLLREFIGGSAYEY